MLTKKKITKAAGWGSVVCVITLIFLIFIKKSYIVEQVIVALVAIVPTLFLLWFGLKINYQKKSIFER